MELGTVALNPIIADLFPAWLAAICTVYSLFYLYASSILLLFPTFCLILFSFSWCHFDSRSLTPTLVHIHGSWNLGSAYKRHMAFLSLGWELHNILTTILLKILQFNFYYITKFHYVHYYIFIIDSSCWWTYGLILCSSIVNKTAINMYVQVFLLYSTEFFGSRIRCSIKFKNMLRFHHFLHSWK